MLRVHVGDIFEVEAQVLVNPANRQPDLGWGSHISERLNALLSDEMKRQRESQGELELGGVCVTEGEGTSFEWIMHAAVLDKYDFNPLFLLRLRQRTSDETLRKACRGCVALARERSFESLAVSAMGAGIGGMNYRKCATIILEEMSDKGFALTFAAYRARHGRIVREVMDQLGLVEAP